MSAHSSSPRVLSDLAKRLHGLGQRGGATVERWKVVHVSPLLIEEVEGDLVLEDGDPDFTVGVALRQHIATYGIRIGDQVLVTASSGEWHAFDALTAIEPSTRRRGTDVKEWGVKGDGMGDDSAAMNACMEANAGGEVTLPNGIYNLYSPVVVPPGTKVLGQTMERCIVQAVGNLFAFELGGGGSSSGIEIGNMHLTANVPQASGGAFAWAASGANTFLHDIILGDNLSAGIYCAGFPIGGVYIDRVFWRGNVSPGVSNSAYGIKIGDGVHYVVGVMIRNVFGVSEGSSMGCWLELSSCDSVQLSDCLFQNGAYGIVSQGAGLVTQTKMHRVACDTCTSGGFVLGAARDMELTDCNAQTNGIKNGAPGVLIESKGVRVRGGCYQHNLAHGIVLGSNAHDVTIEGADIVENNAGGGTGHGVVISPNVSHWALRGNRIGNFYDIEGPGTGKQQLGAYVAAGASDYYDVSHNEFRGNTIAGFGDEGTGTNKIIEANLTS